MAERGFEQWDSEALFAAGEEENIYYCKFLAMILCATQFRLTESSTPFHAWLKQQNACLKQIIRILKSFSYTHFPDPQ